MVKGGARPGAGRKSKFGEPSVPVRVPARLAHLVPQLLEDIDTGHFIRANEARELLSSHLAEVGRKGHIKRSVVQQALWLLGEGAETVLVTSTEPETP